MFRKESGISLSFNASPSTVMHMDLNSCFATIEQQANPNLRGKPLVVAAYTTANGCILAASIEAKKFGIKTGMRVADGKTLYPRLIVLPSDPWKYRNIHLKLRDLISGYTASFSPKSIDEFVLHMDGYLALHGKNMQQVALEIKNRIKKEIGEWLTVSVGIAPNRYLAKVAAGLRKPDGLDEINCRTFAGIYQNLKLTDLTGIKMRNASRLNSMGIFSVMDFYKAPVWKIRAAFHSIVGAYWHARLHGYEVDNVEYGRRSYGNSTAIGAKLTKISEISPILARLTEKMSRRLRGAGYKARGIHLMITYKDGSWWHRGRVMDQVRFDWRDFYKAAYRLLMESQAAKQGSAPVLNIAVSCFDLHKTPGIQLEIFEDTLKKNEIVKAADTINEKWGDFTLGSAISFAGAGNVKDRIAFGGVKELEELLLQQVAD